MEYLIVCIIAWTLVFITIPLDRIKELYLVVIISIIWMIFIDNASVYLGYYSFEHILISVGKASLFQLFAYAGVGVLMINWLTEYSITKLFSVINVAMAFTLLQYIYIQTGALKYGSFDMILSFIHNTAALSMFVWLSLYIVGEDKVYLGNKTKPIIK